MGNEVVNGRVFIDRWKLEFRSESVTEEIPMEVLEVEFSEDGRIYLVNPARPDLRIFTTDQNIFRHPSMKQSRRVK